MESYIEKAMNTELPRRRKINIDPKIGFGLEIENNGFTNIKAVNDAERVICNVDPLLDVKDDRSLSIIRPNKTIEQGIEVVTPVMHNKKDDLEMLKKLSSTLKHINPKYNLSSFQVNLDDDFTDEERLYLLKLYTYFEQIIARFCRGNDPALRTMVTTYSDALYYKMMNSISIFDHPKDIVDTFTENKMLAVNFKKRPRRLIEFRLPNGTNEYTLWFNYINMYTNLVNAVKEKRIDERYLDILLKREKENYNHNYKYQYKCFKIKEKLLEEFLFYIFENEEDKLYFTQQYLGEDIKTLKKAQ